MRTFDDVFAAFGGPARLAEAIGIEAFHAQTMKTRGSIPAGYFLRVAAAAERLGDNGKWITVEELSAIAEAKTEEARRDARRRKPEKVAS